jgi:hypothetical protein
MIKLGFESWRLLAIQIALLLVALTAPMVVGGEWGVLIAVGAMFILVASAVTPAPR